LTEDATLYLSAFIDELVRSGVQDIVVSPGSRSTPLAVLAAEHAELQVWMNIDERSAGFFALGMAKAKRRPVALLCTSGTAAANYMPAVAEANLARVPLIVLTADRPHELRDVGAPQTIPQIGLYGDHVRWFMEMPIPESSSHMVRHARLTAARAAAEASGKPPGPVHLNFPLREPLLPNLDHPKLYGAGRDNGRSYVKVSSCPSQPDDRLVRELARELGTMSRIVIICGPHEEPGFTDAVCELAEKLCCPILADPLSQLRSGRHRLEHIVETYDAFLRDEQTASRLKPDVIIRFGAMPVSKPLLQYMHRHEDSRMIVVDEAGWRDPTLLATDMIYADSASLCRSLARALEVNATVDDCAGGGREGSGLDRMEGSADEGLLDSRMSSMEGSADEGLSDSRLGNGTDRMEGSAGEGLSDSRLGNGTDRMEASAGEGLPDSRMGSMKASVDDSRPDNGLSARTSGVWLNSWLRINRLTKQVLMQEAEEQLAAGEMFEGRIFTELGRTLPPDTVLFAGNSMPIRDLDTFYQANDHRIRIMANRGANGIDGLISTALGISATGARTVLVLGDLSFYHDMNALLAAKLHGLSLTIIVVNNDGGGIFSFLPQSGLPRHYEQLFGTPTGLDYAHAAAMYGATFERIKTWDRFRQACLQSIEASGLHVIEVPTDRAANVEHHRRIWRKLSERLSSMSEE